jgi:hypothetical protein
MATIKTTITNAITHPAGYWFNYWFLANNGAWQSASTIDKDPTVVYPLARPWLPGSWDIDTDEVTVLLQEDASASPLKYRHAYVLLVKNLSQTAKRSFFLVGTEMKP